MDGAAAVEGAEDRPWVTEEFERSDLNVSVPPWETGSKTGYLRLRGLGNAGSAEPTAFFCIGRGFPPEGHDSMNLYTRSGDDGTTGLFSGARVSKDHPRIMAYGTVDEFNACLGLCICLLQEGKQKEVMRHILQSVQSRMFDIGADLATPEGAKNEGKINRISDRHVSEAEGWIDQIDSQNHPLQTFVMPGGTELAARLHLARTMCRRAERLIVGLAHTEPIGEPVLRYMNRVSDLLFAMARLANKIDGVGDSPWTPSMR